MQKMTDDDFAALVRHRVDEAVDYVDSDVSRERERATKYYQGDVSDDLPTIEGRSSVVSRDVRDVTLAILPSLLRIFCGQDKAVEFSPVGPEDEEWAKQATDYCNYILNNDNPGFLLLHTVFKDALVRKTGIVMAWWDTSERVVSKSFSGIDAETFEAMQFDISASTATLEDVELDENGKYSFRIQNIKKQGRVKLDAVPPEELVISEDAKSEHDCSLIGRRCYKRVGDLVARGYDYDRLVELAGSDADVLEEEAQARDPDRWKPFGSDDSVQDPSMREVLWGEYFIRCDKDGDGIIELHKVCTAGQSHEVMADEVVSDNNFALFCPEPEPHKLIGESLADCLDDIQRIRTQLLRNALDGLATAITPRLTALQGAVNMAQLLDNRIGGVVTIQRPDAIGQIPTDKAAPQMAMEAYRMMGEVRQERTGQNQASMGLTPDALQSTSRIAANELVQQAQSRVEMIARIFAETGMRRLFKLMLDLVSRHQDQERVIRLRNKWVPMDPRKWSPDMDVHVNVGLGTGNKEERGVFLQSILTTQSEILQRMGPENPWVDVEGVRNALEDMAELGGSIASRYFLSSDAWAQKQQQMAQQPPQPPKPDPTEMLAKVESDKIQASIIRDNQRLQFDRESEIAKDDRERDKMEADAIIKSVKAGVNPEAVLAYMQKMRNQGIQ